MTEQEPEEDINRFNYGDTHSLEKLQTGRGGAGAGGRLYIDGAGAGGRLYIDYRCVNCRKRFTYYDEDYSFRIQRERRLDISYTCEEAKSVTLKAH